MTRSSAWQEATQSTRRRFAEDQELASEPSLRPAKLRSQRIAKYTCMSFATPEFGAPKQSVT